MTVTATNTIFHRWTRARNPNGKTSPSIRQGRLLPVIHTLCATLPPVSDTPEDLIRRDNAAIALVTSLLPANAAEANLAATYVAAQAHAMDSLLLAREHAATDHRFTLKCGTQAASMLRQARATRTLLPRVQAERRTREADSATTETAAWTEHHAIGLMVQALTDAPPARNRVAAGHIDRWHCRRGRSVRPRHRKRAALIRALGRPPDKLDCGPLSPEFVSPAVTRPDRPSRSLKDY